MWAKFLFLLTIIFVTLKPVLNILLDLQNSASSSGISFDSPVLSHNDPDIDPTDTINKHPVESENLEPTNAENDSNDAGAIVNDSEDPAILLANTDTGSLVSNEEAYDPMSGDGCFDSTTGGKKTKRGWDWNPFHLSFPSLPWERQSCPYIDPFIDTSPPNRENPPSTPKLKPKKPKEPSRNPIYVETGGIPVINGGRQFGGERSCEATRPPRLKTLICGGPAVPEGVIPAQLVEFCFSCTSVTYSAFCLCTSPHSSLLESQSTSSFFGC